VPDHQSIEHSTASPPDMAAVRREQTIITVITALGLLATFVVYRPYRSLPFDFVDFSEFMPLLQRGDSFSSRMRELMAYYGGVQGRFNPIGYAAIALKWEFWRDSSPHWQWIRFATMWVAIALTFRLLRRTGMTLWASLAGVGIFLFSPSAIDGWTRLTMAEPAGTILLLVGCLMVTGPFIVNASQRKLGLAFASLCAVVVLWKEMLAATLLLPVALAATFPRGHDELQNRAVVRTLIIAGGIAIATAGLPVVTTMSRASSDAYTAAFGSEMRPISDVVAHWSLGLSPFSLGTSFPPALTGLALLTLVALFVGGWLLKLRHPPHDRARNRTLMWIALAFPLLGAAMYLPWPTYNRFYAIPFMLGGAFLAAGAISGLEAHSRALRTAGLVTWLVFLVFAGSDAAAQASRQAERQLFNRALVVRLSSIKSQIDTVFLATEQQPPTFWQGIGPTMQRYGQALGHSMPIMVNATCKESLRRAQEGNAAVVFYTTLCPRVIPGYELVTRYKVLKLAKFRWVIDSIRVDLVMPAGSSIPDRGDDN
jgi:hypothetical protein